MAGRNPDPDIGAGARLTYHPVARFGIKDDGPELIETDEA